MKDSDHLGTILVPPRSAIGAQPDDLLECGAVGQHNCLVAPEVVGGGPHECSGP